MRDDCLAAAAGLHYGWVMRSLIWTPSIRTRGSRMWRIRPTTPRFSSDLRNMTIQLTPLVIIGAGGFGREVLDLVRDVNRAAPTFDFLGGNDKVYLAPSASRQDTAPVPA